MNRRIYLDHRIVGPLLLELVLDVLKHQPDHLDDCNDQGSKRQGSRVVSSDQESSRAIFPDIESHLKVLPILFKTGRAGTSDLSKVQYLRKA